MSRELEFHCVAIVEGAQWPVTVHGFIDDGRNIPDVIPNIIKTLKTWGLRPAATTLDAQADHCGLQQSSAPTCPDHDMSMKVSKFTKKGLVTTYFCPKKDGDRYCNVRAHLHKNGELEYDHSG